MPFFFAWGGKKKSHFESTALRHGILKKTALPYEQRQEHSWKKNDCCSLDECHSALLWLLRRELEMLVSTCPSV